MGGTENLEPRTSFYIFLDLYFHVILWYFVMFNDEYIICRLGLKVCRVGSRFQKLENLFRRVDSGF